MYCPRCQANQYIKYGLVNNVQRYKCKNCQYQWTHTKEQVSKGQYVILELDEMWHYIQNKKNKLWIWKVLNRNTGHLIDWECGNRDKSNT